jgi:enoyl-CoA hydratase/carnithine racemase
MSVDSSLEGGVLTLRLTGKDSRNALDRSTVADLRGALAKVRADDAARLAILDSGVERVFSLGMNLELFASHSGGDAWDIFGAVSDYAELLIEIAMMPIPTLAVVDGLAAAGGVELACVCDTVIGTDNASFSIAQLRKGIFPFITSAVLVPRIGQGAFLHWALTGRTIPAKRLFDLGLVHQLCAPEERERTVSLFAERVRSFDARTLRAGIAALRAEAEATTRARIRHALSLFSLNCMALKQRAEK